MTNEATEMGSRSLASRIGLLCGPILAFLTIWLLPSEYVLDDSVRSFDWAGRATLGMMVWMSVWWLTEAVNVTITSLLPLAMFPLLQINSIADTAAPYAHKLIFLYMGGFFLALAMQRWGLGKRIALWTIRTVGVTPYRIIGGFMLTTAVFSAFVSNTATAVMMVAIASNLTDLKKGTDGDESDSGGFATCLMLAIAYSASIGGMATIIGTPPNTFLVGYLRDSIDPAYRMEISFQQWLWYGVPVTILLLPCTYFLLIWLHPIKTGPMQGGLTWIESELKRLGRIRFPEWIVLAVFVLTVSLWMCSGSLSAWEWTMGGEVVRPFAYLSDEAIVMASSFLLFVIPSGRGRHERSGSEAETSPYDRIGDRFVLEWPIAEKLPWGILLLFGGGLTLANAVKQHAVAEFLASQTSSLSGLPTWMLILGVTAAVVFLTELTSNAATTASLIPILAAIAPSLGIHPYLLVFPATFAASCAFMLPVATPPNAIVFGTGAISGRQMARTGIYLNLMAVVVIVLLTLLWLRPLLNL